MRQEANANHDVYMQISQQVEEAGLAAGSHGSEISVIDYARQPVKPVSPDLPVYMAITLFVSLWLALRGCLCVNPIRSKAAQVRRHAAAACCGRQLCSRAQAPTPSTSGLPTGVARIPQSTETRSQPNAKDAPAVWSIPRRRQCGPAFLRRDRSYLQCRMAAPIGPGDHA